MRGGADFTRPHREAGSILIEALVASAILAMILAATFRVEAEGARRRQGLEARRYALMVARSVLAQAGSAIPLAAGEIEGVDGDKVWRLDMQPCESARSASAAGILFCITVSVRSDAGGQPLLTLNSRRLAPSV